jgi:hypothetical protein
MTVQDVLQRIKKSRSEIAAICARFHPQQIDALPGPKPDWSTKDLLAHLAFWEFATLNRLSGAGPKSFDINKVNAELLRNSRERSVADVMQEFSQSGIRVIQEIEKLTDDDLLGESPWRDRKPLWEHLAYDTFVHYEEHLPSLRAWAAGQA